MFSPVLFKGLVLSIPKSNCLGYAYSCMANLQFCAAQEILTLTVLLVDICDISATANDGQSSYRQAV